MLRFFRPEIEATLKAIGLFTLIGLIVFPFAWGYQQRLQARSWQNVACAYRIREVAGRLGGTVEYGRDACETLERLGISLDVPGRSDGRRASIELARTNSN